jgi:hypothetical protein
MIRDMAGIPATGEGWSERLLARIGMLHLLIEAYGRIDTLPPPVQADVRATIGWPVKEEELVELQGRRDRWMVLGQRLFEEDQLRVRRTWLWGTGSGRHALLLDFSVYNQPFEAGFIPGSVLDAEVVFHPGNAPMRAVVRERSLVDTSVDTVGPGFDIDDMLSASADMLARNPWVGTFPAALAHVVPVQSDTRLALRDTNGLMLPVTPSFDGRWKLLAVSGGEPLSIFCEWDGRFLLPLSASNGERFCHLAAL